MQTPEYRWDDLRVLLALARLGSLKAAASDLGINISTVSRRLDGLEAALGQRLFDRTPEGTKPTANVELLLPFAENMENASLQLSNAIDGLESEAKGVVRITAPPGVVDHFLAEALAELIASHPKLLIELDSSIDYSDLTRREADIALRVTRPASGDLIVTRVGEAQHRLVTSTRNARRIGKLKRLEDTRWVTYDRSLGHLPESSWITDRVDDGSIVLRSNSMTAQLQAVRGGAGATIMPRPYASLPGLAELPMAPRLKRAMPPLPTSCLWLVGHRALRDVPRIAVVWQFLLERFRSA